MKKLLLGLSFLVLSFGCAKESRNDSIQNNLGRAGIYQYGQNGQCVSTQTGLQVQPQLCQQGQYGQYGQQAQPQQCYGAYSYQGVVYQCGIQSNCSGFLMTTQQGQQVQCL